MKYLLFLLTFPFMAMAQDNVYPQHYFRNPLAIPISLAGNFGECRPGHFHSGIDIKTEGKENYAVYAAAGGYVSRIKMEPGGFGHAIYITHPNGYTTLYAHLNDFFPSLQEFVHQQQYAKTSWELDISLDSSQFPVKKGQQIAWSGNTGGSTAPHLHFEIRDTKTEHPLNPQQFGFPISDHIAPKPSAIAIYDADRSVYAQQARIVSLKDSKKGYYTTDTLGLDFDKVAIGIALNDYMDGSTNTLAVYTIDWSRDEKAFGTIVYDDIGYDETRYLHACADYYLKSSGKPWFNNLYLLPGNRLSKIYRFHQSVQDMVLTKGQVQKINIYLADNSGNKTHVVLYLKRLDTERSPSSFPVISDPAPVSKPFVYQHPNLKFSWNETALYDDVGLNVRSKPGEGRAISSFWDLADEHVPLHSYMSIGVKPEIKLPFELRQKVIMVSKQGAKKSGLATTLDSGFYMAKFRNFGQFYLEVDTNSPSIKPLQQSGLSLKGKQRLRFEVKDEQTSVASCTATINGHWVCLEQHGSLWFYRIDEYCPKGAHKMQIRAVDQSGNVREMSFEFKRI